MPFKAKERVLPIHAATVITHHDQTGASAGIIDPNPGSSGIQAVLNEFLDQRSGPLDNLPGRDLTGHDIGKETDFAHFVRKCTCAAAAARNQENRFRSFNGMTFQPFSPAAI
jgi:hypothetical protein